MKYDVFLSYSRKDSDRARWFIDLFEGRGWNVFWDIDDIPPGQTFHEVIREALDQSKTVVTLWSEASVESQWVDIEAREGQERGVLYPVLLDAVDSDDLPFGLHLIQATDLQDWDGKSEHRQLPLLVETLATAIAGSAGASPDESSGGTPAERAETPEPAIDSTPTEAPEPVPQPADRSRHEAPPATGRSKWLAIGAAAVVLVGLVWFAFGRGGGRSPEPAAGVTTEAPVDAGGRERPEPPAGEGERGRGDAEEAVRPPRTAALDPDLAALLEKRRASSQELDAISIGLGKVEVGPGETVSVPVYARKRGEVPAFMLNVRAFEPEARQPLVALEPAFELAGAWAQAFEVRPEGLARGGLGRGYNVRLVRKRGTPQPADDDQRTLLGRFAVSLDRSAQPGEQFVLGIDLQVADSAGSRGSRAIQSTDVVVRVSG